MSNNKKLSKTTSARGVGKKTVGKKGKLVGQQQMLNPMTGQMEIFNVIEEGEADINFQKIWLGHILDALDAIGNKKIQVVSWFLKHKDPNNRVIGTQTHIAKELGISRPIVNQTVQLMVDANIIKKEIEGVHVINPEMIYKGSHKGRMNVLIRYKDTNVEDDDGAVIEAKKDEGIKPVETTYRDLTTPERPKLQMLDDGKLVNPITGEIFELDFQLTAERDGEIRKKQG